MLDRDQEISLFYGILPLKVIEALRENYISDTVIGKLGRCMINASYNIWKFRCREDNPKFEKTKANPVFGPIN